MLQRVLLAIAARRRPDLLIADEATTALDVTVQAEVARRARRAARATGLTLLVVSHDLAVVAQLCDHVYVLQHGHVVEHGATRQVLADQREPYTRRLVESHLAFGVEHVRDGGGGLMRRAAARRRRRRTSRSAACPARPSSTASA